MVAKRTLFEVFRSITAALAVVWIGDVRSDVALAIGFTDVTASAGINHLQHPGNAPPPGLFRAGGAAATDFDNDGWVDLFVTRLNARPLLYRNLGNGTFQDVAVSSGFTASLPANAPAWGDIDNDGDRDLYVTSTGGTRFYLYVNNGNGTFSEQASARGAAIAGVLRYGQSATFGDYDGDGYLDIHTNDWATDISVSTSRLLRNLGAANPGYFEDVTAAAGLDVFRPSRFGDGSTDSNAYRYTSTFTDLDRDGHPDLAIAADFHTSQIFWNNGDGTFTDGTTAAGVGTDEDGMGSAIGDFDGDGRLDWFVSALVDVPGGFPPHSGNRLYRNNGDRTFTDQTDLASVRNSGWSWGTTFLDHDNDRDLDLFVTNGWDTANPDQSHLYQNDGGVFADISNAAGVTDTGMGRGLVSFDYDRDGDLDVFLVNHGARPILYRNDGGNENDWLRINVQGTASNRDGIGTFITVDPDTDVAGDEMVREINGGNNYLSHNELTAHFGLGPDSEAVDLITVLWPSGTVEQLLNVLPNQVLNLVENAMPLPTAGDYNHDLTVDAADYVVWRRQLGSAGAGLAADGNADEMVNQLDYDIWRANFGRFAGGAALAAQYPVVPEPSTAMLLIVGAMFAANGFARRPSRRGDVEVVLKRSRLPVFACAMVSAWTMPSVAADEPSNEPKPIPATRPAMKAALEALKQQQPRIPAPISTDGVVSSKYLPDTWGGGGGLGGFGQSLARGARDRSGRISDPRLDNLFTDASFWVVSRGNNCHYCLGHQELKLRAGGLDDNTIAALDSDWTVFDPRQQAVLAYARKLTLEPHLIGDQDIAALKPLFTDAEIIELSFNIARFNSVNRWTDAIGVPQERHFGAQGEVKLTTPTNQQFQDTESIVIPTTRKPRPPLATLAQIQQGIAATRGRKARVTLPTVEVARRELADAIGGGREPYGWERALSQLPVIGKSHVRTWNTILSDEHLSPRLKAELAFISAVHNEAWYAAAHAVHRLKQIGAWPQDLATLFGEEAESKRGVTAAYRLAAKMTTHPHLIADADIAHLRVSFSDAETAQIVQVICMANLFDRFSEALGLPLEDGIPE